MTDIFCTEFQAGHQEFSDSVLFLNFLWQGSAVPEKVFQAALPEFLFFRQNSMKNIFQKLEKDARLNHIQDKALQESAD